MGRLLRGCLILIGAVVCVALLWHGVAKGQELCLPQDQIVSRLQTKYQERMVAVGVMATGALLQVYATKDGKTWSLLVVRTDGIACLMTHGEDYQVLPWSQPS